MQTTGRYEIISTLGQGAAGIVYLAWDPMIRRNVALKVSRAATDEFREMFLSEAQSAGRLNHPNIVSIYDVGAEDDHCYLAMEYIKGTTLESYCHKGRLLPPNRSLEIILDVCKGLDYAHRQGVIHRDIKPSNILLNVEGRAKITDFSIALTAEKGTLGGIRGTPHYLAPEQIKGELISFQSDIFSLGCVLYEILSGEKSFPGENDFEVFYKIAATEPASILSLRKELPQVLGEVIRRAIRKDPRERYHSCMDLAYDLTVALRSLGNIPRKQEKIKDFVDYLHNLSFFSDFQNEQLHELSSLATLIRVPKGKLIASEGEIDDTFYIILSGQVRVGRDGEDIAMIGAGECFGEMALLGGQPRMADVRPETDCILMKITANLLQQLPESIALLFYKNFAKGLVRRLSPGRKVKRKKTKILRIDRERSR